MATERALVFVIRANIADFNKALGDAERNFKKTFGNIKNDLKNMSTAGFGAAASILAPLALAYKDSTEWAHDIEVLSAKVGFNIEQTQRWSQVMTLAGGSGDDLTLMVKKMTAAYEAATSGQAKANTKYDQLSDKLDKARASGKASAETIADLIDQLDASEISSDKASQAFAKLKINMADFGKLDTEGRLHTIFVALSQISDVNERQSIVAALLGKGGQKALAAAQGDFQKFYDSLKVMDTSMVDELAKGKEAMEKFEIAWRQMIGTMIAVAFGGDATKGIETLTTKLQELTQWAKDNPETVKQMKDLALAIAGIGTAIGTLGGLGWAILNIAGAFNILKTAALAIGTFFAGGGWSGAIAVSLGVIGGWFQNLGVIIAGVFGGAGLVTVGAFVAALAGVGFAVWAIVTNWETLSQLIPNVGKMLMDIANIARLNLVMAFGQAKDWIIARWNDVVNWFKELPAKIGAALNGLVNWITQPFKDAWAQVQQVADQIKHAWDSLFNGGASVTVTASVAAPSIGFHAAGGIFNRPTLGVIGEAGPEAVIPLSQLAGLGGSTVNINVGNYMGDEISKRALVRDIQRILNEEDRRRTFKPAETNYYSVGGHL